MVRWIKRKNTIFWFSKPKISRLTKPIALGTKLVDEKLIADLMQLSTKKDNMVDINLKSFVKTDDGKEVFAPMGNLQK